MIITLAIRNIKDNKARTAAIIITVALSAVMLFMSLIYSEIIKEEFYTNQPIEAENANIKIVYSPDSDTRIITDAPLEQFSEQIDFSVGVLELYGTADRGEYINLRGITEEGFNKLNNTVITDNLERPMRKDEIIINKRTSIELGLNIDSQIKIKIAGTEKTFYVAKIAENHSCFEQAGVYVIYGMESYVSEYIGSGFGKVYNKIFIKIKDGTDTDTLINSLENISEYNDYNIGYIIDLKSLDSQAGDIALPVSIGTGCCSFIAIFMVYLIINSGFKKRIGLISKLKSLGAENRYITTLFLTESSIYILIGMLIGLIINSFLLKFFILNLININTGNSFFYSRMFLSVFIAGLAILLFIIYPIIRCKKISIRVTLAQSKNSLWKPEKIYLFISIIFISISIVLLLLSNYLSFSRGVISLIFCVLGVILIMPFIVRFLSQLILKINPLGKGIWRNAIINLKSERSIVNNMRIILAGIIICVIIGSAAKITAVMGGRLINEVDCDIIIRNVKGDNESQLNAINSIEGVYDTYSYQFEKVDFQFKDISYHIHIFGLNPDNLSLMGDIQYVTPRAEAVDILNNSSGMLIDYMYYKVFQINIGDEIPITINNITQNIRVEGFYSSYQYGGRSAIINQNLMASLFNIPIYDTIICKTTKDIDTTVLEIRTVMSVNNLIVLNIHSVYQFYEEIIYSTIQFAYYFTALIILVCFISIIINIINSREERKIFKYQMLSLGFTRLHLMKIELLENLISGVLCVIFSIFSLFIINYAMSNIILISHFYIDKIIDIGIFILVGAAFLSAYLIIALTSYYSLNKKDIVKLLKT